jgi:hypothetical protein
MEIDNKCGLMKKTPKIANIVSIATFIPTIRVSDLPTTLGPKKLIKVNITIMRMAKISIPILEYSGGSTVAA